ncbi:hypothetical protein DPMN_114811 [Dreissena polymorpha]|uniref:PHD-type domain-containing protein n=1 Tax=Dreissena polymorpha TaxID=45954 RepID=A0A9D4QSU7_DREPO|nr:hypothetical protein DPMN_114811 [Dreissena polymorpha]
MQIIPPKTKTLYLSKISRSLAIEEEQTHEGDDHDTNNCMICTESITDTIATDCNACGGWVHQTCENFTSENDQHSDTVQTYICKSCRMLDQHDSVAETDHDTKTTPPGTSDRRLSTTTTESQYSADIHDDDDDVHDDETHSTKPHSLNTSKVTDSQVIHSKCGLASYTLKVCCQLNTNHSD